MGLFERLKKIVLGEDTTEEWHLDGDDKENDDDMSGYYNDYDAEPTVLYSDNPQMPQEIKGGGNPDRLNDATMREVARINATNLIPGQVVNQPRGRQQARRPAGPRRIGPSQAMVRQQQQMGQQQVAANEQWQRQQWEQQERQRQQWEEQQRQQQEWQWQQQQQQMAQQSFYQSQGQYYGQMQQPQQQQQQSDAKQPKQNEAIHKVPAAYGEPYYEMIVANGKYHFYMDLPGVKKEDVAISYVNMYLVITGVRHLHSDSMAPKVKGRGNKGNKPEFEAQVTIPPFVEKFNYQFEFPRPVDHDSFKTELEEGVLRVTMDILGAAGPGGIQIKVE